MGVYDHAKDTSTPITVFISTDPLGRFLVAFAANRFLFFWHDEFSCL
jgi:hypothetical protein